MSKYFQLFPKIQYNIQGSRYSNRQIATNIFFRIRFIREVLGNISSYYDYIIPDGDTPEILADKIYGDPEAHWVILLANDIIDPQYDWPLNTRDFDKFIISKYGSLSTAKITYHHYEKVIRREDSQGDTIVEFRYVINSNNLTQGVITLSSVQGTFYPGNTVALTGNTFTANVQSWNANTNELVIANDQRTPNVHLLYDTLYTATGNGVISAINSPGVPFDYYYGLAETQSVSTHNLSDGKTIIETIYRDRISNYDWELDKNEKKRTIKIIKKEYYGQIVDEFQKLTDSGAPFVRRFR